MRRLSRRQALLVAGLTAAIGVVVVIKIFAAGSFTAFEPESGTLTSPATVVADTNASGGQAVKFSTGATGCTNTTGHPAGFANNCTTGYANAPGYPGHLNTCSNSIQSNTTYSFCDYPNGLGIGSGVVNVTFIGCRFRSNALADANVADYGDGVTFSYSTFMPSQVSAPPTPYNQGYQYGIDQRVHGALTVDHSDFWGWGNGIQIGFSSQAKPLSVTNSWFHDARADGGIDHTDAILENYGGPNYTYMTFTGNTIASVGNTNGLGLQDGNGQGYDHVTINHNYFAGFGYTANLGGHGPMNNSSFTNNVWGSDFPVSYGPLYSGNTGGATWSGNTYYIRPGTTWFNTANNGRYWWPSDNFGTANGENPATFTAHTTDY